MAYVTYKILNEIELYSLPPQNSTVPDISVQTQVENLISEITDYSVKKY